MTAGERAGDFSRAAEQLAADMRQRAYTRVWNDRYVDGLGHAALFRDTLSANRSGSNAHFVAVVRQEPSERPDNLTWVTYSPTSTGPAAIGEALGVFAHSFTTIIGNGAGELFAPPPPAPPIQVIETPPKPAAAPLPQAA